MSMSTDQGHDHGHHPEQGGTAVVVESKPLPKDASQSKPEPPRAWSVVLLDDDDHTYEYVIALVAKVFRLPIERGVQIARTVDTQGRAVCMTTHRELAELKQQQIHAFGADPFIANCKGSMTAVLVPAEGDDSERKE